MRKGIRQVRKCTYCIRQVDEHYVNGRFKAYLKRCKVHKRIKGGDVWNWKGGKTKRNGYVYILDKNKHEKTGMSRYSGEHRLVIEKQLGRKLKSTEIVHHLNGIRHDNRIENLVLINGPMGHETWTYVKSLQKRIRDLEVLLDART